ncbi:MAG: DUF998 domain-containing protein [Pseudonocardiales bacterium]|nr:MAG: DUF998 domain-containing protein [Pseudonocardiales bacterium]
MRQLPRWTVLSAACAPVFMIGGWTLAAALQPGGFDSVTDTISALAAHGATDRWVMTAGLAGVGLCDIVTAVGLRPAGPPGRLALAAGGAGTLAVAAFPLPEVGSSAAHFCAAAVGFVSLAVWPALAWRRASGVAATAALLVPLTWFAVELFGKGDLVGLSERFVAGSQALCPLVVVLLERRAQQRSALSGR